MNPKTRRSIGPDSVVDAEASIPTPVSIADDDDDVIEVLDDDGDVVMASPTAGTSANPIELVDDEQETAPPVVRRASEGEKLSPRKLYGLHVQQLIEIWGDGDEESVIRGTSLPHAYMSTKDRAFPTPRSVAMALHAAVTSRHSIIVAPLLAQH